MDEKSRVLVPKKFAEKLGSECVIAYGPDRHIRVYPLAVWEELENLLINQDAYDEFNSDLAFLQRMFGNCDYATVDTGGRLTLPSYLRDWADLKDRDVAIIIGNNNRLEIWSRDNFELYSKKFTERVTDATIERRKSNTPPPVEPAPSSEEAA